MMMNFKQPSQSPPLTSQNNNNNHNHNHISSSSSISSNSYLFPVTTTTTTSSSSNLYPNTTVVGATATATAAVAGLSTYQSSSVYSNNTNYQQQYDNQENINIINNKQYSSSSNTQTHGLKQQQQQQQQSSSLITKSMVIRPPHGGSSVSSLNMTDNTQQHQQQPFGGQTSSSSSSVHNNARQAAIINNPFNTMTTSSAASSSVPVSNNVAPVAQSQQHQQQRQQQDQASMPPPTPSEPPTTIQEYVKDGDITYIKEYKRGELLGKGGFAKCYHLTDMQTNQVYAAKVVLKSSLVKPRAKSKIKAEIRIHSSLNHENIVKFEHCFETEDYVFILLGLCNQKTVMDLHKRRKFLLECEVKYYVYQVIQAVKYLHDHKIIHRDLKLGNLFIDNMRIKLGDFGLSTRVEHEGERKKTICGTPNYIAPEVLDKTYGHSYEADVWSIGIILYTLLVGKPPFETPDVNMTYKRIQANQYSFPDEPAISQGAKNLIVSILNPIPEHRPNLNQILDHEFFSLSTIPKHLPVSALTTIPTHLLQRSTVNTNYPLTENTNIINQQQQYNHELQQQQQPQYQSPQKQKPNLFGTLSPKSQQKLSELEKDDFHYRKLRRLEKMKENDMKTKLIKQKLALPTEQQQQQQQQLQLQKDQQNLCNNVKDLEKRIANNHISDQIVTKIAGRMSGFPTSLVFVARFEDHTNKYGLSYNLSNGSVGAYFNDSTKVISFVNTGIAHYMEHAKGTDGDGKRILNINEPHPHDTQKKVTLIKYFSQLFLQKPGKFGIDYKRQLQQQRPVEYDANNNADVGNSSVYVKKWRRSSKGVAFRLSDNTIQVNFDDNSIIIITKDQNVTYISDDENIITDKLSNFLQDANPIVVSRIKYTRDIVESLYHKKPE